MGMLFSSQFIGLTACSPKEQLASIIGIYNLFQQIGSIIGTSLSSALVLVLFQHRLCTDLPGFEGKQNVIQKIIKDFNFSRTLPGDLQSIIHSSYIQAFRSVPCEFTIPVSLSISSRIWSVGLTMTQFQLFAGAFWLCQLLFSIEKGGWLKMPGVLSTPKYPPGVHYRACTIKWRRLIMSAYATIAHVLHTPYILVAMV